MADFSDVEEEEERDIDRLFDDAGTGEVLVDDVGNVQFSGWKHINNFETEVFYDDIDKTLLEAARTEIPIVMEQIKNEIPGCTVNTILTPNDFFNMWLRKTMIDNLIRWIKKHTRKTVSEAEIGKFIQVEFYLSAYRCSPTEFYNSNLQSIYTVGKNCMKKEDYLFILNALSGNKETDSCLTLNVDDPSWKANYTKNKDLERVVNSFRDNCVAVANVPGKTKLGIDDDMIRLRSRTVAEEGYSHINNPAKGMGMVHHGIVSVPSRLFIGGQIQLRGQTTLDCMTMLQRSLCSAGCDSQIDLDETLFFWDRGYGGPDGIVNQETLARNGLIVGTSKRTPSYPFNFGKQKQGDTRTLISEKGTLATYWAEKNYRHGKRNRKHYAMAFRDGRGSVVLMHGSGAAVRPGEYVYITEKGKGIDGEDDEKEDSGFFLRFEDEHITKLTSSQGTPEWFLMRQFRITATAAYDVWNAATNDPIVEDHVSFILDLLAFTYTSENVVVVNDPWSENIVENHEVSNEAFPQNAVINVEVPESIDTPASRTCVHAKTQNFTPSNERKKVQMPELYDTPSTHAHVRDILSTPRTNSAYRECIASSVGPADLEQHLRNSAVKLVKGGHFETDYSSSGEETDDSLSDLLSDSNVPPMDVTVPENDHLSHVSRLQLVPVPVQGDDDVSLMYTVQASHIDDDVPDDTSVRNDAILDVASVINDQMPIPFPYKRTQISRMNRDVAVAAMRSLGLSLKNTENGKDMTVDQMKSQLRAQLAASEDQRQMNANSGSNTDTIRNIGIVPNGIATTAPTSIHNNEGRNQPRRRRRNLLDDPVDTSRLYLKLLHTWFMAPLPVKGVHATKIGQSNEKNIIAALPRFFELHQQRTGCKIIRIKEYGLLSFKNSPTMAFSPDGIVLSKFLDGSNVQFLSLLEMKTKVSDLEEDKEKELAELHGKYVMLSLRNKEEGKQFKALIPETKHRTQLLHGMACSDLISAFYVVASATKIIRIVHVQTSYETLTGYRLSMWVKCRQANLNWVNTGILPEIPQEEYDNGYLSHVRDERSLRETLSLWHCINDKIVERGSPLPRAKFILPKLVALWNRCKGPIDLYSRFLFNVKARHPQLSPTATIWMRMIMTCAYNAFMSYALNASLWYLMSSPDCKSFRDYQLERTRNAGDFKSFLVEIANSMSFGIVEIPESIEPIVPEVQRVTVLYNTRRCFFPGAEKDSLRLAKVVIVGSDEVSHGHALIPEKEDENGNTRKRPRGPQHCCVLCCKGVHKFGRDQIYKQCKKRDPYRPRWHCTLCNVSLCREKKYAGMNCYDLWHSLPEIPVYCMNATILNVINETEGESNENLGAINFVNDDRMSLEIITEAIARINEKKGYRKPREDVQERSPPPRSIRGSLGQRLSFSGISEVTVPRRFTRSTLHNEEGTIQQQATSQQSVQQHLPETVRQQKSQKKRRARQRSQQQSIGSQTSTVSSLQLSASISSQRTSSLSAISSTHKQTAKRQRTK